MPCINCEIVNENSLKDNIISNIDLTEKLYLWNGTFTLYCDIYLTQKDLYDNDVDLYLTTKILTYVKDISDYEFTELLQNYLNE
jgi:hypothetical protein